MNRDFNVYAITEDQIHELRVLAADLNLDTATRSIALRVRRITDEVTEGKPIPLSTIATFK